MKNTKSFVYVLGLTTSLLLLPMQIAVAISLDSYVWGLSEGESYYTSYARPIVGYDFVPNTPLTIGALGAYDHHFDGLERPNQVGLWERSTGILLASATVPAGVVGQLEDGYRWMTIAPISLSPAVTYTIASWNSGYEAIGTFAKSEPTLTVDSKISLTAGYVDTLIPGLQMPTRQGGPGYVFIGPGFASVVPEPSSLVLLVLAAGPVYLRRLRITKKRRLTRAMQRTADPL